MLVKKILVFLLLNLAISNSYLVSATTQNNRDRQPITKPPAPPPKIPPNKIKPGGGLEVFKQSCSNDTESLTALVPIENPVFTVNPYPTLFFYVPDAASKISYGKFSLVTADEKKTIYSDRITLKNTPGIIKIQLPKSAEYALQEDKIYHWYLKLYCQENSQIQTYLDVNGWIQKVALTPDRAKQIEAASPDIWYDSLAKVAADLSDSPNNPKIERQWFNLLQEINLENLAQTPISIPDSQQQKLD